MARNLEALQKEYNTAAAAGSIASGRGPGGGGRMNATNVMVKPKKAGDTIRRILSYVAEFKRRLALVFCCMLLSTAASLAGSYVLRPVINGIADASVPAEQRIRHLAVMLCVMIGIYLVAVLGTFVQARLMIGVSRSALQRIRDDLFTKLEQLPLSFHDNETTGDLMSRFTNDVDNIGLMLDQTLLSLVSGSITLVGTLGMMIYTNL